jgi:hypothetical protein
VLFRQRERAERLAGREAVQPGLLLASVPNWASGSATSELFTEAITATTALAPARASIARA